MKKCRYCGEPAGAHKQNCRFEDQIQFMSAAPENHIYEHHQRKYMNTQDKYQIKTK